jgi:hypothetical protein
MGSTVKGKGTPVFKFDHSSPGHQETLPPANSLLRRRLISEKGSCPQKQPFFSLTPSQTPGHPLFRLQKRPEGTYFRVQFVGKYIKRGEKWAIPKKET